MKELDTANVNGCMCLCVYVCMCACVRACVRVRARLRVCVRVHVVCVRPRVFACVYVCVFIVPNIKMLSVTTAEPQRRYSRLEKTATAIRSMDEERLESLILLQTHLDNTNHG